MTKASMHQVDPSVAEQQEADAAAADSSRTLLLDQGSSASTEETQSLDGSSGLRLSRVVLPTTLLVAAAVCVAVRWGGLLGGPSRAAIDDVEGFALIEEDTHVQVLKDCAVHRGVGDWTPIDAVLASYEVVAEGPATQTGDVYMLPIKAYIDGDKKRKDEVGAVKVDCLDLPEGTAVQEITDCDTDFDEWEAKWVAARKNWCCARENKGCITHPVPGTDSPPRRRSTSRPGTDSGWDGLQDIVDALTDPPSTSRSTPRSGSDIPEDVVYETKPRPNQPHAGSDGGTPIKQMPWPGTPYTQLVSTSNAPPLPVGTLACSQVSCTTGYKVCHSSYCGADVHLNDGNQAVNVESEEACVALCDQKDDCVAYELYGLDIKQCTLRPVCAHPMASNIGTKVALKLSKLGGVCTPAQGSVPPHLPVGGNMPPHRPVGQSPGPAPGHHSTLGNLPPVKNAPNCGANADYEQGEFNCQEGYENWVLDWSVEKQQYCCETCGVACVVPSSSTTNYAVRTWFVSQASTTTPPPLSTITSSTTTGSAAFDCDAGLENAYKGWSVWKRRWCCSHENQGCGVKGAIQGHFRITKVLYVQLQKFPMIEKLMFQAVKQALVKVCSQDVDYVEDDDYAEDEVKEEDDDDKPPGLGIRDVRLEYWQVDGPNVAVHFGLKPNKVPEYLCRSRLSCKLIDQEVLKNVNTVPDISKVTVPPIGFSHCTVDHSTTKVPCVCQDGDPVGEDECDGEGANACSSCDPGFTLTAARTCDPNQCTCSNGMGAVGGMCHDTGAEVCGFCQPGYHLGENQDEYDYNSEEDDDEDVRSFVCLPNECICEHGNPSKGPACPMDQAAACHKCIDGYHKMDHDGVYSCEGNQCWCDNGDAPDVGSHECPVHEAEACVYCHDGFHLDPLTKKCVDNKCNCDHGTPAVGPACKTDGTEVCVACDGGSFLGPHNYCGFKKCECDNGVPVEGDLCTTNRGKICQTCNPGYRLFLKQCVPVTCDCPDGAPSATCNASSPCSTCQQGFHKTPRGLCRRNQCKCSHGVFATGPLCLENGLEVCASCKPGYHPVMGTDEKSGRNTVHCVQNKCKCEFGQAAETITTPLCHTDESEICTACKGGYYLGPGDVCRMKKCRCDNGYGTRFDECENHGSPNCKTCLDGYHLTTQGATLKNTKRCKANEQTKSSFDCDAGFQQRLLGWSLLKKDWCCQNKGIACLASGEPGSTACSAQFAESECKLIGCCHYNVQHGCHSAVGDKPCVSKRTLRLKESPEPGYCLVPNQDMTAGTTSCNEHDLQGTSKQYWHYNKVSRRIESLGMPGKCLEASTKRALESTRDAEYDAVLVADCADASTALKAQQWTFDASKTRFETTIGGRDPWCLGVRKGFVQTPGARVVVRKCDVVLDAGQDWVVPDAVTD